jgi:hypothetical protein
MFPLPNFERGPERRQSRTARPLRAVLLCQLWPGLISRAFLWRGLSALEAHYASLIALTQLGPLVG